MTISASELQAIIQDIYDPTTHALRFTSIAYARLRTPERYLPLARGAWVQTWDDDHAIQDTVRAMLTARGQRGTFNVNSSTVGINPATNLTVAQVQQMIAEGHEVGSHGVTHSDLTALTAVQRAVVLDKAPLEAIVGVGQVSTFCYPYGFRTTAIDKEMYLRYERVMLVSDNEGKVGPSWLVQMDGPQPFLIGRYPWEENAQKHAQLLELIRVCARERVILVTFAHKLDVVTPGSGGPTTAQFTEALDLAASLGVPIITAKEAFPGRGLVRDGGFEDSNLYQWNATASDGSQTAVSVVDTPDTGMPGTRSLKMDTNATGGAFIYVGQLIPVKPLTIYTASVRYRTNVASGGGFRAREFDYTRATTLATSSNTGSSATWATLSFTFTTNANARFVTLEPIVTTASTTTYYDHVDFGPTAEGTFG